jgi:hypothetical protein
MKSFPEGICKLLWRLGMIQEGSDVSSVESPVAAAGGGGGGGLVLARPGEIEIFLPSRELR